MKQREGENQSEIKKIQSLIKQSREELEHCMFMTQTLQKREEQNETNENALYESTGSYKVALTG